MSNKKSKGLGKGLGALLDLDIPNELASGTFNNPSITELSIDVIVPNSSQPRTIFDETLLDELAQSIEALGVIQPITVREERNGTYKIISGERRYRASKLAGIDKIPAYIRKVDDERLFEMALVENIQREDLNAMDVADGLNKLIEECGITHDNLSKRIGKNRSTITNYIRLLRLEPEVQVALKNNIITMGHARALLAIDSTSKQLSVLRKIIKDGLSVRQVEKIAKEHNNPKPKVEKVDELYPESYARLVETLERYFDRDISIKRGNNGAGKIVIGFNDDSEIESIIKRLDSGK